MRRHALQTGYTLIELLLYIAMVGVLLAAVTAFFGITADARVKNQSMTEVDEQAMYALDMITQVVRNGTSISAPTVGANSPQLTVVVPTASLSPTVFDVSGGILRIKEGTSGVAALTNHKVQVTSFTVTNLTRSGASDVVQISLSLSRVNPSNMNQFDYAKTFTTSVGVRP